MYTHVYYHCYYYFHHTKKTNVPGEPLQGDPGGPLHAQRRLEEGPL